MNLVVCEMRFIGWPTSCGSVEVACAGLSWLTRRHKSRGADYLADQPPSMV